MSPPVKSIEQLPKSTSEIAACSSAAARRLILAVGLWSLKIKSHHL
jgi:hypothetical protein